MEPNQTHTKLSETNDQQYAGFLIRLLAYLVDFGILMLAGTMLQYSLGNNPLEVFQLNTLKEIEMYADNQDRLSTVLGLALGLFYFVAFWVNYDGATPGKKLLGLRIIRENNEKLNYASALIRYLGSFISTFGLFLGYVWIMWDKKKQGWHDKIASTYVVKTGKKPQYGVAILISILVIGYFTSIMVFFGIKGFEEARQETNTGSNTSAQQYREQSLEMNPQAKAHYDRSAVLFEAMRNAAGDREEVIRLNDENILELKKALIIEPENARLWNELGNAYTWISTEGTLEDSLEAYQKAEELQPEEVVYINAVGDALIRLERYDEAVLQFQKTLRKTDRSGYANLSLGVAYANLEIKDQAKFHYEEAIEIFTDQNDDGSFDNQILRARTGIAELDK